MFVKRLLFLILLTAFKLSIFAQSATVIKRLGKKYTNKDDYGNKMIYDPLDNTIVVYSTTNYNQNISANNFNLFITKLDTCLNVIWDKEITTSARGQFGAFSYFNGVYSVYLDKVITGNKAGFSIINIDQSGNVISTSPFISFPTGSYSGIFTAERDPQGNHILNGSNMYTGGGRIWNLKVDLSGNVLWSNLFYKPLSLTIPGTWDVGLYCDFDSNNNIYFSGRASSCSTPANNDLNLIKCDANGNISWAYQLNRQTEEEIFGIKYHNNGVYLYGAEFSQGFAQVNASLITFLDDFGNIIWAKRYTNQHGNLLNLDKPVINSNGNLIFTGAYYKAPNYGQPDLLIIEIDKNTGDIIGTKSIANGYSDLLMNNSLKVNNSIYFHGAGKIGARFSTIVGKTTLENYFYQPTTLCVINTPTFIVSNYNQTPINSNFVVNGFTTSPAPLITPTTIVRTNSLECGQSPQALFNLPTSICLNQCLSLRDSSKFAPNTWLWTISGPGTAATINTPTVSSVCFTNAGVYTVKLKVENCTWKDSISKSIFVVGPNMVALTSSSPACVQGTLSLSAPIAVTYTWSGPNNFSGFTQSVTVEPLQLSSSGVYSLTSLLSNGCVNNGSVNITVHPLNTFTPTISNLPCVGGSVSLLPQTSANSYTWLSPSGIISNNSQLNLTDLQTNANGIYTLVVTNNFGCSSFGTYSLNVNATPSVKFDSIPNKCLPFCLTTAAYTDLTLSSINWVLNGNLIANSLNLNNYCLKNEGITKLELNVTSNAGCSNKMERSFIVYPKPLADFKFLPDAPSFLVPSVQIIDNSSSNVISWNWTVKDTNGIYTYNTPNFTYNFNEIGNYYLNLSVISDKGCKNEITKVISIENEGDLYIPNAFTPNDDGMNDVFKAKGVGITKFEMQIFDRWGHLVFESNDIELGWNGRFKNQGELLVKQAVYTYKVSYYKGSAKQFVKYGNVTLLPK